jgi:agmatinase
LFGVYGVVAIRLASQSAPINETAMTNKKSSTPRRPRPADNAFKGETIRGGVNEPTYGGALSFMRRHYAKSAAGADLAIWGVPFDAATSNRPGTRFGPRAIRAASAILEGDPQYPWGFDPFAKLSAVDVGDCSLDYGNHDEVPREIEKQAKEILATGATLLTLGGDHFVTYPLLKAHAAKHGPLALVQFDAHQDTWHPEAGRIDHGSFVARAAIEGLIDVKHSIQIGIRTHAPATHDIEIVHGNAVETLGVAAVAKKILKRVGKKKAYLSFDIDALDPAFAPGTGTPVAGGLTSREALMMLRLLAPINFVGFDVMEVSPPYDQSEITAIAAAHVAMHFVSLVAMRRGTK